MDSLDLNASISVKTEDALKALNCIRANKIFAKIFPFNNCDETELNIAVNKKDLKTAMLMFKKNNIEVVAYKSYEENIIGTFYENIGY